MDDDDTSTNVLASHGRRRQTMYFEGLNMSDIDDLVLDLGSVFRDVGVGGLPFPPISTF